MRRVISKALFAIFVALAAISLHPAKASATICSQPYSFTPGQLADANQVDADFSALVTCGNSLDNTQVGPLGFYASQILPASSGTALFGGSYGYTFGTSPTTVVPLTSNGPTGTTSDLFDVDLNSTKKFWIDSAGNINGTIGPGFNLPNLTIYSVLAYGALCNGSHNDYAGIEAAITAASATGGIVLFPSGTCDIGTQLTVTSSHVILVGAGLNSTKLVVTTSNGSAVSFAGSGYGGSVAGDGISNMGIYQNSPGSGGVGVNLYYTAQFIAQNLQVDGFFNGVQLQHSTNSLVSNVLSHYGSASPSSGFIGFLLNGNPAYVATTTLAQNVSPGSSQTVNVSSSTGISSGSYAVISGTETVLVTAVGTNTITASFLKSHSSGDTVSAGAAGDIGGNVSSIFRDCSSGSSDGLGHVSTNSIGFKSYGSYVGDALLDNFSTSFDYYGIYFDASTAAPNTGSDGDIFIRDPVIDEYYTQAILLGGPTPDSLGMVSISGGWIDPNPSGSSLDGIYLSGWQGASVNGTQFLGNTSVAPIQTAILGATASGVTPSFSVSNAQFVGQKYGFNGSAIHSSFTSNRFTNPNSTNAASVGFNFTSSSQDSLIGNSLAGYESIGVQMDAGSSNVIVASNAIDPTHITTPVTDSGTNDQVLGNSYDSQFTVHGPMTVTGTLTAPDVGPVYLGGSPITNFHTEMFSVVTVGGSSSTSKSFGASFTTTPVCTLGALGNLAFSLSSISTSGVTVANSSGSSGSVDIICEGY